MLNEDIHTNVKMAKYGADSIVATCAPGALTLLTHCNTGSLATAGYGTALGTVIAIRNELCSFFNYCIK